MTFTMLECFLAAMETMNFTTAGQNVHMTQPAFSRNIAALEDELGFPLFIRDKQNGLRPTTAMFDSILRELTPRQRWTWQ